MNTAPGLHIVVSLPTLLHHHQQRPPESRAELTPAGQSYQSEIASLPGGVLFDGVLMLVYITFTFLNVNDPCTHSYQDYIKCLTLSLSSIQLR